jgi:hypothetical protein
MAEILEISVSSANQRLADMCRKAGVGSPRELVAWGWQHPHAVGKGVFSAVGMHPERCLCPACRSVRADQSESRGR